MKNINLRNGQYLPNFGLPKDISFLVWEENGFLVENISIYTNITFIILSIYVEYCNQFLSGKLLKPKLKTHIWFSVILLQDKQHLICIEIIITLVMSFMLEESEVAGNILQGIRIQYTLYM